MDANSSACLKKYSTMKAYAGMKVHHAFLTAALQKCGPLLALDRFEEKRPVATE